MNPVSLNKEIIEGKCFIFGCYLTFSSEEHPLNLRARSGNARARNHFPRGLAWFISSWTMYSSDKEELIAVKVTND